MHIISFVGKLFTIENTPIYVLSHLILRISMAPGSHYNYVISCMANFAKGVKQVAEKLSPRKKQWPKETHASEDVCSNIASVYLYLKDTYRL